MPTISNGRELTKEQLIELNILKDEYTQLIESDPVRFFRPTPGGQYDFLTTNDESIQGLYFFAGNKTGKTTGAAVLVSENACGRPLWGREFRTVDDLLFGGRLPLRICCFCEDFPTHNESIVPTILSWMPSKEVVRVVPGHSVYPAAIICKSGSVIFLRTYDQGFAKAEGKDYDLVWCDEPPPRPIYTAIWRGLVVKRGRLIIAATLLAETWLYEDKDLPFIKVFEGAMSDNPWLDRTGASNFESLLDEEERAIRMEGKPSSLSGLIYGHFRDAEPFVIPFQKCMWDPQREEPWPTVLGVDPHERRPLHCEWGWVTPSDGIIWYDWALIPSGILESVFDRISDIEKSHMSPTTLVVMDPNRGPAKQIDGRCWMGEFEARNYSVLLGIDDIEFGHNEVRDMIYARPPRMQWMETCRGGTRTGSMAGPIYHMLRYQYREPPRGSRFGRLPLDKPMDKYKDFPDIHRYVAAAHLDFKLLTKHNDLSLRMNSRGSRVAKHIYF